VYSPQNSGKEELINQTLKITLSKLCQETQSPCLDMLPLTLLRAHCTPRPPATHPLKLSMADLSHNKQAQR
jgi:hypothetical protein